jgi:NAD(P)H dehydrogenase (quinone)
MEKIMITGATGQLGSQVLQLLTQKVDPANIVALVRKLDDDKAKAIASTGVEVREADYTDYNKLLTALQGIDKLYFVSAGEHSKRGTIHLNVVEAIKAAGIKHVIYTSLQHKDDTENSPVYYLVGPHIQTEKALKESGITYTILRHNVYTDFIPFLIGNQVPESGVVYFPAGNGKIGFTLRQDMAEVSAEILATAGHENQTYDISIDEVISFGDIAEMIAEITGKEIKYVSPGGNEYMEVLVKAGLSELVAEETAEFGLAISRGEYDITSGTVERFLKRKPVYVRDFLKGIYHK